MIKKTVFSVIVWLLFIINVNGDTLYNYQNQYDYYIDQYDIEITVNEDNSFDIIETLKVYFNVEKHGIYRKIPLKNNIIREDQSKGFNRAKITDVDVNNKYVINKSDSFYEIKIGDKNKYIKGKVDYVISYKYNIGKDDTSKFDEFYFNIIGDQWDTYINEISFKAHMPKSFNQDKIGFSLGSKGTVGYDDLYYSVEGKTIKGIVLRRLEPNEALTIRLELEEGYFSTAQEFIYWDDIVFSLSVLILFFDLIYIIYQLILKNKHNKIIVPIEFYPPKNCNSTEAGYIYNGDISDKDIMSLLVYLASKGYIEISEKQYTGAFKTTGYRFKKIKDYDGNNKIEKQFMDGLFELTDDVTDTELKKKFYKTVAEIKKELYSKEIKDQIFERKYRNNTLKINVLIILTFILISIIPNYLSIGEPVFISLVFPITAQMVITHTIFNYKNNSANMFLIIFFSIWGGFPWLFLILPGLLMKLELIIVYMSGLLIICFMQYMKKKVKIRTQHSNELYCKLQGLKNFINIAEKEKLEALIMENPSYFYDIIPYAYVFGLTKKWISNFEGISIPPVSWYDGHTSGFNSFMINNYSKVTTINTPTSSSGGGSGGRSGGSSSGGGSGGGGGGSW
ncbi:MAG TPA: DUF2207 domain-containing protein [Tenericutes bacterium]|nr:DUF2207 domain-containing protein [Mycoplasmatota bacterium]